MLKSLCSWVIQGEAKAVSFKTTHTQAKQNSPVSYVSNSGFCVVYWMESLLDRLQGKGVQAQKNVCQRGYNNHSNDT